MVAKERRRLLSLIAPLLTSDSSASGESCGGDGSGEAEPAQRDNGAMGAQGSEAAAGTGSQAEATSGDAGPQISVGVVLALVEEVMAEEFPGDPERICSALQKLQRRMKEVLLAAQVTPDE